MRTSLALSLTFAACSGGAGTTTSSSLADSGHPNGFTIEGTATDIATGSAAAGCVTVLDPTPMITGAEPLVLASGVVLAGAFALYGVTTTSPVGLDLVVDDCATGGDALYPTVTGIPYDSYAALGDGDVLQGQAARSVSNAFLAELGTGAAAVGYSGDLGADGLLFGFVVDGAGAASGGATVLCAGAACTAALYLDGSSADGLLGSGSSANLATDASAGGVFLVPAPPIANYSADDGGAHAFAYPLNASRPGEAAVLTLVGQ